MKIIVNPKWTKEQVIEFRQALRENDGYCPCRLVKNEDAKCLCKEFRESESLDECHCGLYTKTNA